MKMVSVACIISHKLCIVYVFLTFMAFSQKICNQSGWYFTWVYIWIVRNRLCIIYAIFEFFVQKLFLTEMYFQTHIILDPGFTGWGL